MSLTPKQQRFCEEYLIDLNATQAAIRAGYSEKTANEQGSRLLANVSVAEMVQAGMDKRSERVGVDADYVLNRLTDIDKMSVKDIMNNDMTLKPLSEWPDVWCQSICSIDVSELALGQNNPEAAISFIKKLKWPDPMKSLELLGKHHKLFTDKVEVGGDLTVILKRYSEEE